LLSKTKATIYVFYHEQAEFSLLRGPPTNSTDVFASDVGFIATVDEKGGLARFNAAAGGGMGVTHGNEKTYPRTVDYLGFRTAE